MIKSFSKCLLFGLLVTLFTVFSCSKEEEFEREQMAQKAHLNIVRLQEALAIPIFSDAYQKITNTKNLKRSAARTALEEAYDFDIVATAPVKVVTAEDGTISYTMLIERLEAEELKFENLVIIVDVAEISAIILKHELASPPERDEEQNSYKFEIVKTIPTPLEIDGKEAIFDCFVTVVWCNNNGHGQWDSEPHQAGMYRSEGNWNNVSQLRLANVFLRMMNIENNFNVSLYRIKFNSQQQITGGWEKVNLAATQYKATTTPCN